MVCYESKIVRILYKMNTIQKKGLWILLILCLSSCTHSVHMYTAGDVDAPVKPESMKKITAESEQFTVLGFVYDTNYIDQAVEKLRNQCKKGSIHFISSRYSTSHGFLSWKNKIHLEGYCMQ